ncbi:hypothetical protein HZB02_07125 [Candidatus Woesearchaeota archaeon]|nr:hypothetical protein [Candidatus Woesearchaeota archaeon]
MKQPQEIEVWYVLPAIRKHLTKLLVEGKHLSQKKIAEALGITEAAVSQYLKEKRAGTLTFPSTFDPELKKSVLRIKEHPETAHEEIQRLCTIIRTSSLLCDIHRKWDKVPKGCDICLLHHEN